MRRKRRSPITGDRGDDVHPPPAKRYPPDGKRRRKTGGRARLSAKDLMGTQPDPSAAITPAGVLFTEHGVDVDPAKVSTVPSVRAAFIERELALYRKDFFYRALAHPKQLMFLGKVATMSGREELAVDRAISERDNRLQKAMFRDCEDILKKAMSFPDGAARSIPRSETDGIARKLHNHLHTSRNTFAFRYQILRLFHAYRSFEHHIRKMVPPLQARVMKAILGRMLISPHSPGFESTMLFEDNKFGKLVQLVRSILALYMANYGYLRVADRQGGVVREEFFLEPPS